MRIGKAGSAENQLALIAVIKALAQASLLVDNGFRVAENG
ncbi:hypothetical protein [Vibrio vulnificus YJ016]|uniref:Uncharacterized protein n=1 Tax=Vibrio vulnificus (strain YJ016) TaxID=196600 RepID=Q7MQ82_VIBVY|nr:hypothetical protein [Vibrio vulnificus YJ016]